MISKYFFIGLLSLSLLLSPAASRSVMIEAQKGVRYEILSSGNGITAARDMIVDIHLAMWRDDHGEKGEKLFDSRDEGRPISFKLGTKGIGEGLDIGVMGIKVGETRRLHIPARLNPKKASGKFPGNADLIFEVELLDFR